MGGPNNIKRPNGFTIVELVVVITVIGILALITNGFIIRNYRERTHYSRSISELNTMANAVSLYVAKYNAYPDDVTRDIPAGLKEFVQSDGVNANWPNAPWPGSVYDWDNWPPDSIGPQQTYQISIRFCDPGDTATCKKNFPKEPWVTSDWDSNSAVYFCISGSCRSHQSMPMNHPGYCINCGNAKDIFKG
ncbi:MAG TPA: type II secretion system protein [Methylomirabilota bacterium]|nr:type II secretion system protein [Methylomirabilota bacterium]